VYLFLSLKEISLDIAEMRNTGMGRAHAVEECVCPVGYRGLSCEVNGPRLFVNLNFTFALKQLVRFIKKWIDWWLKENRWIMNTNVKKTRNTYNPLGDF